jgi:hypothetical protein
MGREYEFGESEKTEQREGELSEFLERMFDEEDRPYFVSDEACLYDIYAGDDAELSRRCERWYGKELTKSDFRLPVWRLLDSLYGEPRAG